MILIVMRRKRTIQNKNAEAQKRFRQKQKKSGKKNVNLYLNENVKKGYQMLSSKDELHKNLNEALQTRLETLELINETLDLVQEMEDRMQDPDCVYQMERGKKHTVQKIKSTPQIPKVKPDKGLHVIPEIINSMKATLQPLTEDVVYRNYKRFSKTDKDIFRNVSKLEQKRKC